MAFRTGTAYPSGTDSVPAFGVRQRGRVISIVDDDATVRDGLRRLMDMAGLEAQTFASAEEFLGSPSMSATTCLILDGHMPGIDGLELQRRLRTANWKMPIIFISAHGEEMRARALEGGAVAFFAKPFSTEALLEAIDAARAGRPQAPAAK